MADKKINIDIAAVDDRDLAKIDRLIFKLGKVADQYDRIAASSSSAASTGSPGTSSGSSVARSGRPSKPSNPTPPPLQVQTQAQAASVMAYARAQLAADPNNKQALRLFNQANKKYNQLDPMRVLTNALLRTRFTGGGSGSGVVGHMLGADLLKLQSSGLGGIAAQVMGLGGKGAAGASGGIASALSGLATMGAEIPGVNVALASLALVAGGAVIGLAALNNGLKQTTLHGSVTAATDAFGGTEPFRGNLTGMKGVAAAMAGINPVGGMFGDNDYGKKQTQALDYIRGLRRKFGFNRRGFDQARGYAEALESPDLAQAYLLNDRTYKRLTKSRNPQLSEMKEIAEFNANLEIATTGLKMIMIRGFTPFLNMINWVVGWLGRLGDAIMEFVNRIRRKLGLPNIGDSKPKLDNTQAIEDNTRAIKDLNRSVQGGDVRAKVAASSRIAGSAIDVKQFAGKVRLSTAF